MTERKDDRRTGFEQSELSVRAGKDHKRAAGLPAPAFSAQLLCAVQQLLSGISEKIF